MDAISQTVLGNFNNGSPNALGVGLQMLTGLVGLDLVADP
jgi:hypothetical protein